MRHKPGTGSFCATGPELILRPTGIRNLILTGITSVAGAHTAMRETYGYQLITDATECHFPLFKAAAIAMIVACCGIVGWAAPLLASKDVI